MKKHHKTKKRYFIFKKIIKNGFTLIELLVAIAIISILATVVIVSLNSSRQKARDTERVSNVKEVSKALELYKSDNGGYPTTNGDWSGASSAWGSHDTSGLNGYVPNLAPNYIPILPTDPKADTNNGYVYRSDGVDYFFMAYGTAETTVLPFFRNPNNPTASDIVVYTSGYVDSAIINPGEGKTISGKVTYATSGGVDMHDVSIYLKKNGTIKYTATTPSTSVANYTFTDVVPGTYEVYFSTPKGPGGINVTDAAHIEDVVRHGISGSGIKLLSGDVFENSPSIILTSEDSNSILQYFVTLGSWPVYAPEKFVFAKSFEASAIYTVSTIQSIHYAAASASSGYSNITIDVGSSDMTQDFIGQTYGDVNASRTQNL